MATRERRYGLVGAGSRAQMYVDAVLGPHADVARLVAMADTNRGRLEVHRGRVEAAGAPAPALHHPDELEAMIVQHGLDRVVVTSPDHTHAEVVDRCLRAGADVVVEKPLTTDAAGARRITQAVRDTGRSVVVTFNYRYSPRNTALKALVASGAVGRVTSVHFEWVLDTKHGADYFRRWHRDKNLSGGLLVHKASHHFDLVNWWLEAAPTRVFASGGLRFYGAENAAGRGLGARPARGSTDDAAGDPFALDLRADPALSELYLQQEHEDGYLRDVDVFSAGISIEDNMSLVVDYDSGASMSYSLNAHAPWEGYTVAVNGTEGRAELTVVERGAVEADGAVDPSAVPEARGGDVRPVSERLLLQRHWSRAEEVPIPEGEGGHGGGDVRLLRDVFVGPGEDPLGTPAGYLDGVRSIAVGAAGNVSLSTGRAVLVEELDLGVPLARGAAPAEVVGR